MCNLNVLVNSAQTDYTKELQNATAASYARNYHADGVFCSHNLQSGNREDGLLKTSPEKLDLRGTSQYGDSEELKLAVTFSPFVITHQRIATSGYSMANAQPFSSARFILAHNGILSMKKKHEIQDMSDTFAYFTAFVRIFDEENANTHASTRKLIKKAITRAMNETTDGGSYSITLFDKKEQVLYYFKNEGARITAWRLEDGGIFFSTADENCVFFPAKREISIKSGILYAFTIESVRGKKRKQKRTLAVVRECGRLKFENSREQPLKTFATSYWDGDWTYKANDSERSTDFPINKAQEEFENAEHIKKALADDKVEEENERQYLAWIKRERGQDELTESEDSDAKAWALL